MPGATNARYPFDEQGVWSDKNSSRLRVKLICHRCYEQLRPDQRKA